MKLYVRFGPFWRFLLAFEKVYPILGVNSTCSDGRHVIFWDFDDIDFEKVYLSLRSIQIEYNLPNIYIFETSPNHYYAMCMKKVTLKEMIKILLDTPYCDWNFIRLTMIRGFATLRISPKRSKPMPKLIAVLESSIPEDIQLQSLSSFVVYDVSWEENKKRLLEDYRWDRYA